MSTQVAWAGVVVKLKDGSSFALQFGHDSEMLLQTEATARQIDSWPVPGVRWSANLSIRGEIVQEWIAGTEAAAADQDVKLLPEEPLKIERKA